MYKSEVQIDKRFQVFLLWFWPQKHYSKSHNCLVILKVVHNRNRFHPIFFGEFNYGYAIIILYLPGITSRIG